MLGLFLEAVTLGLRIVRSPVISAAERLTAPRKARDSTNNSASGNHQCTDRDRGDGVSTGHGNLWERSFVALLQELMVGDEMSRNREDQEIVTWKQ